jgi:hypothetical protein
MKWAEERDLLIAQTMAFVQSITGNGKKSEIEARAEARTEFTPVALAPVKFAPVEVAVVNEIEKLQRPIEIVAMTRPQSLSRSDVREEIQSRVAAFRAHQQLFHRERDAYFNSVLPRLRASTRSQPKLPGG